MHNFFKHVAIASQTPVNANPSFFETGSWRDVGTIGASKGTKVGVYFLAKRTLMKHAEVCVVKMVPHAGNELFSHLLSNAYGLRTPTSKLIPMETDETLEKLNSLSKAMSKETVYASAQFGKIFVETKPKYVFAMMFINGKGIDTIKTTQDIGLFKERKFLKALGAALPFDALICNGDRFKILHPGEVSNCGNMILEKDGSFVAIDNGINALADFEDYADVQTSHYHDILKGLVVAVKTGNQTFINEVTDKIVKSLIDENPLLTLNEKEKNHIGDGIIAGILKLQKITEDTVRELYARIPEDSGKTEDALNIDLQR